MSIYTEITLKNAADEGIASSGLAKNYQVRQTTINALVDTGAWTLIINEETRKKLGLKKLETKLGTFSDDSITEYCVAGPVKVIWNNRHFNCDAIVLPDVDDILLGAIPLDAMDLTVHPNKEKVVGAHGDKELHRIR